MADKNNQPFNFGNAPLVRQTEQTIVNGYEAIESEEQRKSEEPTDTHQAMPHDIPAAVTIGHGEPTQNINVPIPISLHSQLAIIKAKTRQNMKDLVVLAIKEYVDHQSEII